MKKFPSSVTIHSYEKPAAKNDAKGESMENIKVDVIIPVYHPGKEFSVLLERLTEQTAVIHRIIAMNTEENYWNKELEQKYPLLEVHHLKKSEFDHGGTRAWAAELSDAEIMVFMTQDAVPADRNLIENLVKGKATSGHFRPIPRWRSDPLRETRSTNSVPARAPPAATA